MKFLYNVEKDTYKEVKSYDKKLKWPFSLKDVTMLEGTGAGAAWRGFGSPADDGLSAFLGGGRSPVDASAKAAAV